MDNNAAEIASALKALHDAIRCASLMRMVLGEQVCVPAEDAGRIIQNRKTSLENMRRRISDARRRLSAAGFDAPIGWSDVSTFVTINTTYGPDGAKIETPGWDFAIADRVCNQIAGEHDRFAGRTMAGLDVGGGNRDVPYADGVPVGVLRKWTGLSETSLVKYAKDSRVKRPKRGQRNFRYSLEDARAVLLRVRDFGTDQVIRDNGKSGLRKLEDISKKS